MRVLLVGVGGAGCRIVNSIYDHDINSPIRCTEGIFVDRDAEALNSFPSLPRDHRIFYQPLDRNHTAASLPSDLIVTKLQNLNPGDIDAIIVCAGLGGRLALGIQPLVRRVRESMFEPVFGLFTLPCHKEGDDILGLAADGFDSLLQCQTVLVTRGALKIDPASQCDRAVGSGRVGIQNDGSRAGRR